MLTDIRLYFRIRIFRTRNTYRDNDDILFLKATFTCQKLNKPKQSPQLEALTVFISIDLFP